MALPQWRAVCVCVCVCVCVSPTQGSCRHNQELWIIMEYCGGGSVNDLLSATQQPMPEQAIAYVCSEALKVRCFHGTQRLYSVPWLRGCEESHARMYSFKYMCVYASCGKTPCKHEVCCMGSKRVYRVVSMHAARATLCLCVGVGVGVGVALTGPHVPSLHQQGSQGHQMWQYPAHRDRTGQAS